MGDLVAVMQAGGVLAQFAPPAELLAQPGLGLRGPLRRRRPRPQAPVAEPRRATSRSHARGHRPARRRRRGRAAPRPGRPVPVPPPGRCRGIARIGWLDRCSAIPATRHARRRRRRRSMSPLLDRRDDAQGRPLDAARRRRPGRHRRRPRRARSSAWSRPTRSPSACATAARRREPAAIGALDLSRPRDRLGLARRPPRRPRRPDRPAPLPGRDRRRRRLRDLVRAGALGRPAAACSTRRSAALAGILYTIPSLALFAALVPITGLTDPHGRDPARPVHPGHPRPQHRGRLRRVPPDVLEAADGMGYDARQRLLARRAAAGRAPDRRRAAPRQRLDDRPGDDHGHPRRSLRRPRLLHLRGLPALLPDRDPPGRAGPSILLPLPSTSRSSGSSVG